MTELQSVFFSRLNPVENVQFDNLHEILLKMGYILPYENLDVMGKNIKEISI
ncbi:hypothetical protein ERICI_02898 [Paenibacillus larvae subsp. larvae]|nr:hypothetical protein ERICI_02898 [Paenibacillus larvae subsp. larvae]